MDLFASSGGAVNALALVAKHPEDVRTLVAHEPPAVAVLPDRENAHGGGRTRSTTPTSAAAGAPAMAKFIAVVSYEGPIPDDYAQQPAPDPAMFGMPAEDDGSRTDVLLAQNMLTGPTTSPISMPSGGIDAHRHGCRAEAEGTMADRGAVAVAERLGVEPVIFPSGHGGFLGGEYGQQGEPDAFAAKLREVLATAPEVAVAGR